MRPTNLHPNNRGIIESNKNTFVRTGGNLNYYTKKVDNLRRLDRLMKGERPDICITRKSGGIGDVLMTLPTVKHIAKKYDIKVDYGTEFDYLGGALVDVLQGNPYINRVLRWRDIDPENYDTVLDLTCPCVAHEQPKCKPIHRIDLFARHLGLNLVDHDIDFVLEEKEKRWAREYVAANNLSDRRLLFVQPSSSTSHRDCPPDKLEKAIAHVVANHRDIVAMININSYEGQKSMWNCFNTHKLVDLSIRQKAALLQHTKLAVCPDSAWLHIAAAFHHPTLALFGPTDPNARVNYHPEAVAYWPAKELANYPVWYSDPHDGYLCWKLMDHRIIGDAIIAMVDDKPLPACRDFVTFGRRRVEHLACEIV